MAQYVYGVVARPARRPRGKGIAGAPLGLVEGELVSALASELPDADLELSEEDILIHARVLSEALDRGAVLPMRFGFALDGADEVRELLLEPHGESLRAQLEWFEGKVEVKLRVSYDEPRLLSEVVGERPEIARLREQLRGVDSDAAYYRQIELGELVAQAVEDRRQGDAQRLVEALGLVADDVRLSEPESPRVAMSGSFLVRREALPEFDEMLEALAQGAGGRLLFKYVGPLPPYSFVAMGEEAPQWVS